MLLTAILGVACLIRLQLSKHIPSLQNRRISGASKIDVCAREARVQKNPHHTSYSHHTSSHTTQVIPKWLTFNFSILFFVWKLALVGIRCIAHALPSARLSNGFCWLVTHGASSMLWTGQWISQWVRESVSESVSQCVSQWVSEWEMYVCHTKQIGSTINSQSNFLS